MSDIALLADSSAEVVRYAARPGLAALPPGTGMWIAFAFLQILPLSAFLFAIWWPTPIATSEYVFSIGATATLVGLMVGVAAMLIRRAGASARGLVVVPFIRLVVSDRRVLWQVPWRRHPLIEIGADRVRGGLLGEVDRRGRGDAAIILQEGDYAGDAHGMVHFSGLPRAAQFVEALGRLG